MNDDGGDSNATVFIGEPLEDGSYTHMRIGNEVSACRQSSSVVGAVYFVPRAPLYGTGPRLTPPRGGGAEYIFIFAGSTLAPAPPPGALFSFSCAFTTCTYGCSRSVKAYAVVLLH